VEEGKGENGECGGKLAVEAEWGGEVMDGWRDGWMGGWVGGGWS
jgi:hypothetical protein